jgi:type IV pilus assembly protein PilQ
MKTLLRLALLTLCGAVGIMLALHLAALRPESPEVAAAVIVPHALPPATPTTETPPQAEPAASEPTVVAKVDLPPPPPRPEPTAVVALPQVERRQSEQPRPEPPQATIPAPRTAQQFPTSANMPNLQNMSPQEMSNLLQQATSLLGQTQQNQNAGAPAPAAAAGGAGGDPTQMLMQLLNQTGVGGGELNGQLQQIQARQALQQRVLAEAMGQLEAVRTPPPGPAAPALAGPANAPAAPAAPVVEELAPRPPAIADEGDGRLTIHSRDDDLRVLLEQLGEQAGLNIMAAESVQGTVTVNLQDVNVDEALRAILKVSGFVSRREGNVVYIGTSADFANLERSLDRIGTRVYRPNYLNAKELQTLLTPLLTPSLGKISITTPSAVGIATDTAHAGGEAIAQQDAIVVQDYEQVLAQIDQVFKELDRRPMQVSIEAVIVQVALSDQNTFGVDFQLLRDKEHVRFGWGNPRITPLDGSGTTNPATGGKVGEFTFDPGGLKFAFLDDSLGVFLNALETIGNVNVVASPKLLCLNKQKAEILIGQRLGYISTTMTQTFSSQNVEFLDVGTQLRLRPFISSDGIVRMEVHPELSTGTVTVEGGFTLPNKNLTEVTTNVMCPDGCTVIIGGLMREDISTNSTQVPLLGSMPWVGPLFRNKSDTVTRTEVLVLLTPRIIYDGEAAAEGRQLTRETQQLESSEFQNTIKLGAAHVSRQHLQRAQQAWSRGNRVQARRQADLALHFDPGNRDAVRMLNQLNGDVPLEPLPPQLGVETIVGEQAGPATVDGEQVPAWMLNDLDGQAPPLPIHPRDPGVPGREVEIIRPEVFQNGR